MAFPLALVPVALSAVQSLIKLRGRVDTILSVKEGAAELPFKLPPLPDQVKQADCPAMIGFFQTGEGQVILEVSREAPAFDEYLGLPENQRPVATSTRLLKLFYQATGRGGTDAAQSDPNPTKAVIDHYLVASYRLSNNPASVRILLATADTVLEFAGSNASLFISNPKTANIVGTLLREFAGRNDFDDRNLDRIFKTLLGSAVVTALEVKDELPDHPALLVLYAALGEVRQEKGDDFTASIISAAGFKSTVAAYLKVAARDPEFIRLLEVVAGAEDLEDEELQVIRGAFAGALTALGEDFDEILQDPAALKGVLEAAVTSAAANTGPLIRRLEGDRAVLAAVLQAVAAQVAARRRFFDSLGNGELIGEIYRASLQAVATNPDLDGDGVNDVVEKIVGALADELSEDSLRQTLEKLREGKGIAYVNRLLSCSVGVLAEHPELLVGKDAYARAVVGAVLTAGVPLIEDGLEIDDLVALVQEAIRSASGNLRLVEMDATLRAALAVFGQSIAAGGSLRERLATPAARKDTLLVALQAVAASPEVWSGLDEQDLVQPVAEGLLQGLAEGPENLLTGPAMVEALRESLRALAQRGRILLDEAVAENDPDIDARTKQAVRGTVLAALEQVEAEIGASIAKEQVPAFLGRVLQRAFKAGLDSHSAVADAVVEERRLLEASS